MTPISTGPALTSRVPPSAISPFLHTRTSGMKTPIDHRQHRSHQRRIVTSLVGIQVAGRIPDPDLAAIPAAIVGELDAPAHEPPTKLALEQQDERKEAFVARQRLLGLVRH